MISITNKQMGLLDHQMIEDYGLAEDVLMENAALRVVEVLKMKINITGKSFLILLGKGNNGGDGLAIARLLYTLGGRVTCVTFFDDGFSNAYEKQRLITEKMGINIFPYNKLANYFKEDLPKEDVVIDALFGTGFSGSVEGMLKDCLVKVNDVKGPLKVAVDIPSGLNGNTGRGDTYFKSDVTVTFAYPKWGHLLADVMGEVYLGRISFDPDLEKYIDDSHKIYFYRPYELKEYFLPRNKDGHKGTYGHLGILGGSYQMGGAPLMAGLSALRMGSGLVTLWVEAIDSLMGKEPELMLEKWSDFLNKEVKALLIGPGLGHDFKGENLQGALENFEGPVIIDADGFSLLKEGVLKREWIKGPLILTPHPKEMGYLLGKTSQQVNNSRIASARECAIRYQCIAVLKGHKTVVVDEKRTYLNLTGNPGMGTAGSGDVLGGIIGSLAGRMVDPYECACAGVYLHGLAGDLIAKKMGEESLIAGDIIKGIPLGIQWIKETEDTMSFVERIR